MAEIKNYKKGNTTVHWDDSKCIHSGICAQGLASVFKPRERPWVQVDGASEEEIRNQIDQCPSKALYYSEEN